MARKDDPLEEGAQASTPINKEELIRQGSRITIAELEQFFGFKFEISGFDSLETFLVDLKQSGKVSTLLPDFEHYPERYQPLNMICFLESGQPVMGIVLGNYFNLREWNGVTSLVNLAEEQEKVILASSETMPLNTGSTYWAGYNINKHEHNLRLGWEVFSVAKLVDNFVISFPLNAN